MPISRYSFNTKINTGDKDLLGTNLISPSLYRAVSDGLIKVSTRILEDGERLDTIANSVYGDSSYWWVIAAASGIGWPLQVPPGTYLSVPTDLNEVFRYAK